MKTPLRYQATSHDCGPTSLINALLYLFEREEIAPEVVNYIMAVCCDKTLGLGVDLQGTSRAALAFLATWFNTYVAQTGMPIRCEAIAGSDVSFSEDSPLSRALASGAVAVVGCNVGADHYVLVTKVDGDCVQLFDPYYDTPELETFGDIQLRGVTAIEDAPFSHNRLVERWVFEEPLGVAYTLNAISGRDAVLVWRTK